MNQVILMSTDFFLLWLPVWWPFSEHSNALSINMFVLNEFEFQAEIRQSWFGIKHQDDTGLWRDPISFNTWRECKRALIAHSFGQYSPLTNIFKLRLGKNIYLKSRYKLFSWKWVKYLHLALKVHVRQSLSIFGPLKGKLIYLFNLVYFLTSFYQSVVSLASLH